MGGGGGTWEMQTSTSKRGSRFLISMGDTKKERSCTQDMVGPCLKLEIGLLPGKQKKLGGKKREIYFYISIHILRIRKLHINIRKEHFTFFHADTLQ